MTLGLTWRPRLLCGASVDALMDLIDDLKAAKAGGATDADLKAARAAQRRGQFYLDFVDRIRSTGGG